MVTSEIEKIESAAVAQRDEICKLSNFFRPYQQPRAFSKEFPRVLLLAPAPHDAEPESERRRPPFHHLRDELALLLGLSGSNLVLTIWERHGLSLHEKRPDSLRPALLKLFSTATRIAAPRGCSQGLKAILRGFESEYFPVNPVPETGNAATGDRRFSLLALIQAGQGAGLLPRSPSLAPARSAPSPCLPSETERSRLRREFLFESSCRAKSWTEAYRHSRILAYGTPRPRLPVAVERRLPEVYRMNLGATTPGSKKKQILADIARLPAEYEEQPEEFALRAVSALALSCRPGEDDALLCKVLPPSDPRWRISIRHLYRHRPQPDTWMSTLRKLWQQEPRLRPYCRLLFSLIRFSRRRAEVALSVQPPVPSSERLEPCQLRARLQRGREEVALWTGLLEEPADEPSVIAGGSAVKVRTTLWEHIVSVSHELGLTAPQRVQVVPRFEDVGIRSVHGNLELVVNPVMLSTREGEARFLIARALYRHALGLDVLERRGARLGDHRAIAERAISYTEWKGYSLEPFSIWQDEGEVEIEELQVALEDLYWQTSDAVYAKLCEVLANQCWCPRAELEADIYAHRFCDMIDATYGVIATALACLPLYRDCESAGIGLLVPKLRSYPGLALRLQNLWMSGSEEIQKRLTR